MRRKAGIVPSEWELVFRRLATASRSSLLPTYVKSLSRGEGGLKWRTAVQWSAFALARLMPGKLAARGCPLAAPHAWEAF